MQISMTKALDPLELQMLQMIAHGMQDKQIALVVHRSEANVKVRIGIIKRKLGAFNRAQLIDEAYRQGYLTI